MQRFLFISVLSVLTSAILLLGCGHRPETGESVAEVCHASNDGKLKSVSGYIGVSPTMTSCATTCRLKVRAQRSVEDRELDATFELGTGNNQLQPLPEGFTDKDIRITDNGGKQIKGGDVVRITGRLSVSIATGDLVCTIAATKVETLGKLF